jgi:uncharacterized membrane protein YhaH (DUF805 family)
MNITATPIAAGASSPGLGTHIFAYLVMAFLVLAVAFGVASIFSRRWRHRAVRMIVIPAGALVALYAVGRAIAEFATINYSDPASYHNDWGGPSLAGVLLVHAGPGIAVLIAAPAWLYRHRRHAAVAAA